MKSDVNGCSTCKKGAESWEPMKMPNNRRINGVQYDYRDDDGVLFSTVALNLESARKKRDLWLEKKKTSLSNNNENETGK